MLAIPTIDLTRGLGVQPHGAEGGDAVQTLGQPVSLARAWANTGFQRVNVLDLDADTGNGCNALLIEDIIRDGALDVQVGGGVQSIAQIEQFVNAGAARVVVGPRAFDESGWLAEATELYPGLLIVRTDVRERRVVTRGWVRNLPLDIFDVIRELGGLRLGGLLLSTVGGNGCRTPVDLALLEDIAELCEYPVIAIGGASTMNDLRALQHRGVAAIVLGDVLYSGQLDARAVAEEFDA